MNSIILTDRSHEKGNSYMELRHALAKKVAKTIRKTKKLSIVNISDFNLNEQFHKNRLNLNEFQEKQNEQKKKVSEISKETTRFFKTYSKFKSFSLSNGKYNDKKNGPFKDILQQYDKRNIKPPILKVNSNLFKISPLINNSEKIEIYYKNNYLDTDSTNIHSNKNNVYMGTAFTNSNIKNNNQKLYINTNKRHFKTIPINLSNPNKDKNLKYITTLKEIFKQKMATMNGKLIRPVNPVSLESTTNLRLTNNNPEIIEQSPEKIDMMTIIKENKLLTKYNNEIETLIQNEELYNTVYGCPLRTQSKKTENSPKNCNYPPNIKKRHEKKFSSSLFPSMMNVSEFKCKSKGVSTATTSPTMSNKDIKSKGCKSRDRSLIEVESLRNFINTNKDNLSVTRVYNRLKNMNFGEQKKFKYQNYGFDKLSHITESNQIENLMDNINFTKDRISSYNGKLDLHSIKKLYVDFYNNFSKLEQNFKETNDRINKIDEDLIKMTTDL